MKITKLKHDNNLTIQRIEFFSREKLREKKITGDIASSPSMSGIKTINFRFYFMRFILFSQTFVADIVGKCSAIVPKNKLSVFRLRRWRFGKKNNINEQINGMCVS